MNAAAALARIEAWAAARGLVFLHDAASGGGAVLSPCGQWRYLLWRVESPRAAMIGMGLLNPSTADHTRDDPTIRQCRLRARRAGARGLLVWNLFAWRATVPAQLKQARDPVGPDNDAAMALALSIAPRTVLGWGIHGNHLGRSRTVSERLRAAPCGLFVLGLTGNGQPRHPLYLPTEIRLRRWMPGR